MKILFFVLVSLAAAQAHAADVCEIYLINRETVFQVNCVESSGAGSTVIGEYGKLRVRSRPLLIKMLADAGYELKATVSRVEPGELDMVFVRN